MVCVRYKKALLSLVLFLYLSGRFSKDWMNDDRAAGEPNYTQPATFSFQMIWIAESFLRLSFNTQCCQTRHFLGCTYKFGQACRIQDIIKCKVLGVVEMKILNKINVLANNNNAD